MTMLRTITLAAGLALAAAGAQAAGKVGEVYDFDFTHEGPFGTFDPLQLQRGLQVYVETCAACHGLEYVAFRTLSAYHGPQLPEDQVRAFAAQFEIFDPAIDDFRPRVPTDHFPQSAMATAPDLSLMAKSRKGFPGPYGTGLNELFRGVGGPEYIASLLTGYTGETREEAGAVFYQNVAFPGGWIAMAPPLFDGQVEFRDGSLNTVEAMAVDLAAFLKWTAEPKLVERRRAGFTAVIFLTVLSVLLYLTNKRIWAGVKGRKPA
jgi:ubiquinol-cytochrome c reductase cytochrome c1 subunit